MSEVHYYVHGRGRGHAVRALAVLPRLSSAGLQVRVFAGPEAYDLLRARWPCYPIYSLRPGEPLLTAPKLLQRALWAFARGLRRAPLAALSDGDLPSSVASALAHVPVISIGHGLLFSCAAPPRGVDPAAWGREGAKAARASFGSVRQLAVSFTKAPLWRASARLVRPPVAPPRSASSRAGGVLCYFRDENAGHVLRALCGLGLGPRLFARRDPGVAGVAFEPYDRARFLEALGEADAVVSSAGCQLIAECLSLDVPHLALYRRGDDEQRLNVELLGARGLIDGAELEGAGRAELLHFLGRLDEQRAARARARPLDELPPLEQIVLEELRRS